MQHPAVQKRACCALMNLTASARAEETWCETRRPQHLVSSTRGSSETYAFSRRSVLFELSSAWCDCFRGPSGVAAEMQGLFTTRFLRRRMHLYYTGCPPIATYAAHP